MTEQSQPWKPKPRRRSKLWPRLDTTERRIYIKADGHAKYADVETALDAIRYAGISNITIMVEQRRDLSP